MGTPAANDYDLMAIEGEILRSQLKAATYCVLEKETSLVIGRE